MSELQALLFGAAIVIVFSYERFNRTTFDSGMRLQRLIALLSPDQLRARRVVMRAWLFYTAALLLIYLVFCIYGEVLPALNMSDAVGASALPNPDQSSSIGIPAAVSLSVALILTGLAPSIPVLQRFEEWMRVAAHRLVGIPTRVISDTDELRRNAISIKTEQGDRLRIPRGDWARRKHYRKFAAEQVTAPEDFRNDLDLIFATTAWVLKREIKLENEERRVRFQSLEDALLKRKDVLILELDERTGFVLNRGAQPADDAVPETDGDDPVEDLKRRSWDRVASDVDALAEDFCIMLALYVEHEIIPARYIEEFDLSVDAADQALAEGKEPDTRQRQSMRQRDIAREKLLEFLHCIMSTTIPERASSYTTLALLWSFALILVVTLLWSQWPGVFEFELRWLGVPSTGFERAVDFGSKALSGFFVPLLITLSLRDAGRQSGHWKNVWKGHWTTSVSQIGIALFVSWLLAMIFVVALNSWQVAIRQSVTEINSWHVIRTSFEVEVMVVLRGCILAVIAIFLLDGSAAQIPSLKRKPYWTVSLKWGLWAALIMALSGAVARMSQSWVAARVAQPPRPGLDAIDYGLIFYATAYSALIGFVVIYFLTEVLLSQRAANRRVFRPRYFEPAE